MAENFFVHISILFGITISIAFVMRLLRQPLVVAYIAAGLVAGPMLLNKFPVTHDSFESLAQFGIVLLLFVVGLSLNFEYIKRVGKEVFIGGTVQFVITAIVGFLVLRLFEFSYLSSLFVAVAITFSSTIIVVKLLVEKKELETVYGQYIVGLLLVQDIIAILLLILLNSTQNLADWHYTLGLVVGKALIVAGAVIFLSKKILPWLMQRVATSGEMLFIFTIAWCFGIASFIFALGFGIEIGAVIAGLSLGSSPYQAEISSRLRPLRDFFIVLFFIVLGSELKLGDVSAILGPGLIISAFVVIIQPIILYIVMRRLGYKRRNAFLVGVTAAQVSEFGFILIFKGQELGYLHGQELALLTFIALITIFISSYLITYNNQIYCFLRPFLNFLGKEDPEEKTEKPPMVDVWVIGYHRVGWKLCEALMAQKISFAVIDFNPQVIKKLNQQSITGYFGDISDIEFLETLPFAKALAVISTVPDPDDQKVLIRHIRKENEKIIIIANLHHVRYIEELYGAGANFVMLSHLLVGLWLTDLIDKKQWTTKLFESLRREQSRELKSRFVVNTH
ncbi:MAG: hypothetical protein A3F22_00765 [Candidatus Magasanikbacteria bacterium RIFCSPHIGHO2_12_FULL_41_16]|nr:MAG: hypothetical protein A2794_02740 [Alphaproteobacteria bacterium RIFCSPHIGHO2_01_FULL_40_8]OGH74756.1 MAG: hypothetical protein A3F22_00765 [Candidatus Magasanikbacteria bacterium RIFCSPHIGHO2_12_FULL_41_16]